LSLPCLFFNNKKQWNGKYWQIGESGALVHQKGLETARNIYDELSKTSDHRERRG